MGLIFKWLGDPGSEVAIINFEDWQLLKKPLQVLEDKSGVQIDEYGDTRLSPDHAAILVREIKSNGLDKNPRLQKLLERLQESVEGDKWHFVVGD